MIVLNAVAVLAMANLVSPAVPPAPPQNVDVTEPPEADRGDVYRDPPYAPRPRPDRDYPPEIIELLMGGGKDTEVTKRR